MSEGAFQRHGVLFDGWTYPLHVAAKQNLEAENSAWREPEKQQFRSKTFELFATEI